MLGPCFVMQYLMSFLLVQSPCCGRESLSFSLYCVLAGMWLLVLGVLPRCEVGWSLVCDRVISRSYSFVF